MPSRRPAAKKRHTEEDLRDLRVGLYCRVSKENDGNDKSIREKSVDDQEREGRRWVDQHHCTLTRVYRDPGRSASRFATRKREDFDMLTADIDAGKLDVIWFWEQSRSTRRLGVYAELRDLCRDHGVLWVIRDRVYDPASSADMLSPAIQAIISEDESEKISQRVTRGKKSGAEAGRPPGRVPYGYKRIFDPETGRSKEDVPDTWSDDGRPVEDSPAFIVREIFDRIAAGSTILAIWRDLNARAIPTTSGNGRRWYHSTIRKIAMNPAYAGLRVHQGEILEGVKSFGPPLVDEDLFWTVRGIVTDETRRKWRARAVPASTLVSSIALCGECGAKMITAWGRRERAIYHCCEHDCATITTTKLDDYVEEVMVRWLSDPDVAASLTAGDDSAAAKQARGDAARARVELEDWRRLVDLGEVTPTGYARAEQRLLAQIAAAEEAMQAATVPLVLRGKLGQQARAGWEACDREAKRAIIRLVADIRIKRSERWQRGPVAPLVHERVEWQWLLGPKTEGGSS
jgi:DNA invertase Pin-like site-specific DNA recombinase